MGGGQGLGKTTFALQVMRNLVATGHTAVYFSFDHDNTTLIERLIAMGSGRDRRVVRGFTEAGT